MRTLIEANPPLILDRRLDTADNEGVKPLRCRADAQGDAQEDVVIVVLDVLMAQR